MDVTARLYSMRTTSLADGNTQFVAKRPSALRQNANSTMYCSNFFSGPMLANETGRSFRYFVATPRTSSTVEGGVR